MVGLHVQQELVTRGEQPQRLGATCPLAGEGVAYPAVAAGESEWQLWQVLLFDVGEELAGSGKSPVAAVPLALVVKRAHLLVEENVY